MASLGFQFDATQHEERRGEFPVFPPGQYLVQALQGEIEAAKSGNGQNVWFEFEIMEGDYSGSKFRHYINNIAHTSADAQKIGQQELAEFCKAVGLYGVNDTDELLFKRCVVNLKFIAAGTVDKGRNGKPDYVHKNDHNKVTRYEMTSADGSAPQQRPAPHQTQQQVQQQRPVQQTQPVQQRPAPHQTAQRTAPWNTPRAA